MSRVPVRASEMEPRALRLEAINLPVGSLAFTNKVYVSESDFPDLLAGRAPESECYVSLRGFIFSAASHAGVKKGAIGLNKMQRQCARVAMSELLDVQSFIPPKSEPVLLSLLKVEVDLLVKTAGASGQNLEGEELEQCLKRLFSAQMFTNNQLFCVDMMGIPISLKVVELQRMSVGQAPDAPKSLVIFGQLDATTEISFMTPPASTLTIRGNRQQSRNLFRPDFNFEQLGIGGLDKEFSDIFRRAFASRIFPPAVLEKLGINHVRGMLLYGPPGTGKTLIARQIAKTLHAREPKIVNGPEVLNKYVGASEENIRKLFADAEKEYKERGEDSQLHIIIFDEIDAICKQRGSQKDGTGVHDTIVNQLLSKIDGVDALNNILIIGMTNRKDMIDEALLRPGRLEVHIEIGLPDEHGRVQILNIHTAKMRKNNYLGSNVDIGSIAALTKNYSGAELEGVVKAAASFAFQRKVDVKDMSRPVDINDIKITQEDLLQAVSDVPPAFGIDTENISAAFRAGIVPYGTNFEHIKNTVTSLIEQVRTSEHTPLLSVLLEGPTGAGKTALAASLALASEFPFVKLISPEDFVGASESNKCGRIAKMFDDAYKSPLSIIVIDNIERLMEFVNIGPRFSNLVLQTLLVLIKRVPAHPQRKLLIIGTTSCAAALEDMEIIRAFNVVVNVPRLSQPEEVAQVLSVYPEIPASERDKIARNIRAPIAIKQLILVAEMARQGGATVTEQRFIECLHDCGFWDASATL